MLIYAAARAAALDAFGRFLLASHTGRVRWCTPQAARLLGKAFRDLDTEGDVLPGNVRAHPGAPSPAMAKPIF